MHLCALVASDFGRAPAPHVALRFDLAAGGEGVDTASDVLRRDFDRLRPRRVRCPRDEHGDLAPLARDALQNHRVERRVGRWYGCRFNVQNLWPSFAADEVACAAVARPI